MSAIHLDNVSKIYGNGARALTGMNLTIHSGERLVLVGPSGCGKTTTLRLIAGLEEPTTGRICLNGRDMDGVPSWRRDVAMVFQKPTLMPGKTIEANLNFSNDLRRGLLKRWFSPRARQQRRGEIQAVADIAHLLELDNLLKRKPAELSGGELQRVALGRMLLRRCAIQLLDEPLGQLDGPLRRQLRRQLHSLHRQFPATMIHVTHDSEEALALGEQIAVLRDGVLLQVDSAEALLTTPRHRFVAEFFPTELGPVSFLEGRLIEEAGQPILKVGSRSLPAPLSRRELWRKHLGRAVSLSVRPGDVNIQSTGWPMQVLLIERRTRGSLIVGEIDGARIAAFVEDHREVAAGAVMNVTIKPEGQLFDQETGMNLDV